MPRPRGRAELSPGFLASHRARLDAIGAWTVEADTFELRIRWDAPAALQGGGVPLRLQFHTEVGDQPPKRGEFDPDEPMFRLFDLFQQRRDAFLSQILARMAEVGTISRATVEVHRLDDADLGETDHNLFVNFQLVGDDEHLVSTRYDPETRAFGRLEG